MIQRLLIANRGEIAVRVARGAREMGITPLGIYSDIDANAYHLRFMEESACIGGAAATESYLNIESVIAAAKALRADAVHPGYGFLSERAEFASAVRTAGLTFVGPSPEAMAAMGSKIEAKRRVREHGVPVIPGYDGDDQSLKRLRKEAEAIGFPLLIKASAGGGGRGMRVVESLAQFDETLEGAKREALAAFGSDVVLLERYLRNPRHIEFQILADAYGHTIHLGERECSIQRRHQKIIEEAPSVAITPELRATMGEAAVRAAQSVQYTNAGTCEFMLDEDGAFYFLEMNARLQVEHPVTELVHGIDLVQWQLRIANGEKLTIAQSNVQPRGWAIEARIYAEDPATGMLPATGTITTWIPPEGPGIRLDAGVDTGSEVSVYYDPMLAKLIAYGSDRAQAIARLDRALDDFTITGVRTNIPLLAWIVRNEAFREGTTTTQFLAKHLDESIFARKELPRDVVALAIGGLLANGWAPWRLGGAGVPLYLQFTDGPSTMFATYATPTKAGWELSSDLEGSLRVEKQGVRISAAFGELRARGVVTRDAGGFALYTNGVFHRFRFAEPPSADASGSSHTPGASNGKITAPMPGKIAKIAVSKGDDVTQHALLLVLEAMKMEHRIEAPLAARVETIFVKEGDIVAADTPLMELQ